MASVPSRTLPTKAVSGATLSFSNPRVQAPSPKTCTPQASRRPVPFQSSTRGQPTSAPAGHPVQTTVTQSRRQRVAHSLSLRPAPVTTGEFHARMSELKSDDANYLVKFCRVDFCNMYAVTPS
ncbi:hypothetical protein K470DRAFT_260235 [Piedraia hortae CBS 480.64]|uniref:Uncharacterized protein n=1 Tax=Piedraia hortae CBS 480.64 TaxID=1314780 RepID=A0A6A7BS11_9PEZI|nr:hypothetical protein K470DRAFT_260235 [Piedraia hortae CBS 480.64]